jgi:hypothetical protein
VAGGSERIRCPIRVLTESKGERLLVASQARAFPFPRPFLHPSCRLCMSVATPAPRLSALETTDKPKDVLQKPANRVELAKSAALFLRDTLAPIVDSTRSIV